jgi:hypothetical protein
MLGNGKQPPTRQNTDLGLNIQIAGVQSGNLEVLIVVRGVKQVDALGSCVDVP